MFNINLDISELAKLLEIDTVAEEEVKQAGKQLTDMAQAHAIELANKKLKTRRQMFIDGLESIQVNDDTWVLSLDAKVRWVDDGMDEHSMLDDLLSSPKAKSTKDGGKYIVVPFQHNKGPTQMTAAQADLLSTVKREMAKFKVPYGKIETDASGKPKTGLLHEFDITKSPVKRFHGPGQGHGPIGQVKQGPTGIPFLQGLKVYQKKIENKDGSQSIKRFIMTFRVASSKHRDQPNRWHHPGLEKVGIIDETAEWAKKTWEEQIAPKLITSILLKVGS